MRTTRSVVHSALAVLLLGTAVLAQDADSSSRGVARLSMISGDVSLRRGDSGDFVAAATNSPLVVQDRVLTGPKASAEVQFDWANIIRLAGDTEIRLSELENRRYQVQIAHGLTTFRVLRDSEADVDISTPQVSVRPVKQSTIRILVRDDGETEVTVRSGEVDIYTPRGVERLKSGKTIMVRGTAADPEYQIVAAAREDDWDRWNKDRDRDMERSSSYEHVSRDVYGAEDLDQNGRWVNDPAYGEVWTPRVANDWAPYREG
ncbi:MAG: FecR domain-containing protein, partial [Bryobacteraceae bacterium]